MKDKLIRFIKQKKIKIIIVFLCVALGGVSGEVSVAGIISTILYLVGLALAANLAFEWKDFEKESDKE